MSIDVLNSVSILGNDRTDIAVYWRGFFPSNYIKAEFLALVLRGSGEEEKEIKKKGKTGFSKNK